MLSKRGIQLDADPHLWCTILRRLLRAEPGFQQVEFGAGEHLSLDQLQLGDLALGRPVGSGIGDRRCDRIAIRVHAAGEGAEQTVRRVDQPGIGIGTGL